MSCGRQVAEKGSSLSKTGGERNEQGMVILDGTTQARNKTTDPR